ncbi:hypothetical protein DE146DRAFT_231675 [Phaeosphaeria sp. MPI-PUGE-AT-0046c]|nr:hypothetical protein DE146DRAFT_231675 [Phaeosphaeria sp. MPI-PUGE-AT-0046c]
MTVSKECNMATTIGGSPSPSSIQTLRSPPRKKICIRQGRSLPSIRSPSERQGMVRKDDSKLRAYRSTGSPTTHSPSSQLSEAPRRSKDGYYLSQQLTKNNGTSTNWHTLPSKQQPTQTTTPDVHIPPASPPWFEHDLSTGTRCGRREESAAQSHCGASTTPELDDDDDAAVFSRSTSAMSGSSSDLAFELLARQGTWDWESAHRGRRTAGMWLRRVGRGIKRALCWRRRARFGAVDY